jgi:hypothetical protein
MIDNYVLGFGLINVKCANCNFNVDSMDYFDQAKVFPLKEKLFEDVERLHDEDVKVQHKRYRCTGRKLVIAFCHVAEEI